MVTKFVVEDMNYKTLQKRSKETKVNPKPVEHILKTVWQIVEPLRTRNVYLHSGEKGEAVMGQRYQGQHL